MPECPIFFKDDCLGEFEGNILDALAPLFPPAMAQQVRQNPPVCCKWRVFERITWEGYRGHRFYTEQLACDALDRICAATYEERYHTPGYPGYYSEGTEQAGLPKVCIKPAYFVIWQPGKVQVPTPAEPLSWPSDLSSNERPGTG
jgi:hypothetical protein